MDKVWLRYFVHVYEKEGVFWGCCCCGYEEGHIDYCGLLYVVQSIWFLGVVYFLWTVLSYVRDGLVQVGDMRNRLRVKGFVCSGCGGVF